jgi:integrase
LASRVISASGATGHSGTVEETVCSIPAGLFWSGLILTIYDTGLRVGALMKLRSADLDLAGRFVKARFGTQKQLADQSLPISRETADRLAQIHPERRELLFPWPFSTSTTLTNRLRLLLQRAGLPCTKKDLFHKLRRTNGTYIADIAGEEAAMRQLGHSTLQVTRKYIDRRKLSAPRLVDQMQRPKSVHGAPDPQPAIAGRPVPRLTCEPPPADVDQPREAS